MKIVRSKWRNSDRSFLFSFSFFSVECVCSLLSSVQSTDFMTVLNIEVIIIHFIFHRFGLPLAVQFAAVAAVAVVYSPSRMTNERAILLCVFSLFLFYFILFVYYHNALLLLKRPNKKKTSDTEHVTVFLLRDINAYRLRLNSEMDFFFLNSFFFLFRAFSLSISILHFLSVLSSLSSKEEKKTF